ncbi:MAG: hypothetical protein V3R64_01580 [Sphingomonadales bacterium]
MKRSDMHKKMRGRNLATLLILLGFVVLVAIATYVKLAGGA